MKMYNSENIFAKILRKEIPCEKVYEDEVSLFINDINPIAKIHVLGIPKSPCIDYSDFIEKENDKNISAFFNSVEKVLTLLDVKKDGYKIITNSGINGGQEVPHFHIHILAGEKIKI